MDHNHNWLPQALEAFLNSLSVSKSNCERCLLTSKTISLHFPPPQAGTQNSEFFCQKLKYRSFKICPQLEIIKEQRKNWNAKKITNTKSYIKKQNVRQKIGKSIYKEKKYISRKKYTLFVCSYYFGIRKQVKVF